MNCQDSNLIGSRSRTEFTFSLVFIRMTFQVNCVTKSLIFQKYPWKIIADKKLVVKFTILVGFPSSSLLMYHLSIFEDERYIQFYHAISHYLKNQFTTVVYRNVTEKNHATFYETESSLTFSTDRVSIMNPKYFLTLN